MALPPLDLGISAPGEVEISWPDTGEDVSLETSADLNFWQTLPGAPQLMDGRFRQPVPIDADGGFFRLTGSEVDPSAPVYGQLPDTMPSLFPGESVSFSLTATDPAGLPVTYLAEPLPLPAGASLNMTTGEFSWTPTLTQTGNTTVTFLAFNGKVSGRLPVTFNVKVPPVGGETSLSGIVLDTTDAVNNTTRPIVGVEVSLLDTGISAVTGADGRFLLQGVPGGKQILDLATASAQPAPDGSGYAGFREAISVVGGIPNTIQRPLYLPRLAMASLEQVDPNFTTNVNNPDLDITLTVPPHTAMVGENEFDGQLSISEVPEGLAPAAMPENLRPGLLITIQPVGVTFAQPVPISFPNVDNLTPGSETDIWSIDPELGQFIVVGKGLVSADGTRIDTIEGGVRAADWHFAGPPSPGGGPPPGGPPPCGESECCGAAGGSGGGAPGGSGGGFGGPFSSVAPESFDRHDNSSDLERPLVASSTLSNDGYIHFSSEASPASGALRTWFNLPSYESVGVERRITFVYNSNQAYPHLLVPMNGIIPVRSAVPPTVSARLKLAGVDCGVESFMSTAGFSESRDEPFRIVMGMNASSISTGVYPAEMKLTSNFASSSFSADVGNEMVVLNRRGSVFGNGWGLAGLQQVFGDPESPTGVVITDGNGAGERYSGSLGSVPFAIATLSAEQAGGYSLADGEFFDDAREAFAAETEASLLPIESLNTADISPADVVFIQPYRSSTEGRPLSVGEQNDIMSYVRGGGCVVGLLDHTLGRASVTDAVKSIADLFQVTVADVQDDYTGEPLGEILNGFFGVVPQVDRPFGGAAFTNLGPWAVGIGDNDGTGFPGAFIPADAIAPGSGPVVLLPDAQSFVDDDGYGLNAGSHRQLLLNAFGACIAAATSRDGSFVLRGIDGAFGTVVLDPDSGTMVRRLPDGGQISFDASGRQRRVTDPSGNVTTYDYSGGNLSRITDPVGRATNFTYAGGKLARVTDPVGRVTTFNYTNNDLVSVALPGGATRRYGYDERSLMISETDTNGGQTTRVYDPYGCILSADIPGGIHREMKTAAAVGLIDPSTGVGTKANPAPPVQPEDTKAVFTDGAGRIQEYVFNPDGSSGGITDAIGAISRIQRDADLNPVEEVRSDGSSFNRVFDRVGRMVSETNNVTGGATRYEYEGNSHYPSAIIDALNRRATVEYDPSGNGNFTRLVSAAGLVHTAAYNARGQLARYDDPVGASTTYEYDALGNILQSVSGPEGNQRIYQFTRDTAGRMASFTDADGRAFSVQYDAMGNLSRVEFAGGRVYTYEFNGEGKLVGLTPPGRDQHRIEYNAEGMPVAYIPPSVPGGDSRTTFDLDGDGKLTAYRRADNDDITLMTDAADRIATIATDDGTITLHYDTADHPTRVEGPGSVDMRYQFAGPMLTALTWEGGIAGTVRRTYNAQGIVSSVSVDGGAAFDYAFNGDGQFTRIGAYSLELNPATGLPQSDSLGNLRGNWQFNPFGNVTSYATTTTGGTALYSHSSTYDPAGRLTEVSESLLGTTSVLTYNYDAAGRLASASRDGTLIGSYTYDDNQNRLQAVEGAVTRNANYDAQDRLVTLGGNTYTYDLAGDLTQKAGPGGTTDYHFDAHGNLLSVAMPGKTVTYEIDGAHRRVAKKIDGVLERGFLWQDKLRIAAELDGAGNLVSQFAYPGFGVTPIYMVKGGQTYALLSDFRGSPRLVVNTSTGAVAQRMDYDVWGRVITDTNPGFQPFGFGGGIYDPDTGLVRMGTREYDPESGRFMTKETEFFWADGGNLYAFADGDPINHVDSTGLDHWLWGCVRNPNADIIREMMTPEEFRAYVCKYKLGEDAIKNLAIDVATAGIPARSIATKAGKAALTKATKELTNQCPRGKGSGNSSNR